MKIQSKIDNLVKSINGYYLVTLQVPKIAVNDLFKLKDDDLDVEIKKHREKRSLTANSYLWVLCRELAKTMESTTSMFDVYKIKLREYSSWWDEIIVSDKIFNYLKKQEDEEHAEFRVVDELERKGNKVRARVYLGSSKFDSKEMSRVIDGLVQDCKEQGIDTMPPDELARLIGEWSIK